MKEQRMDRIKKFIEKNIETIAVERTSYSVGLVKIDPKTLDFEFTRKNILDNSLVEETFYCKACKYKLIFRENIIKHIIRDHFGE